MPDGRTLGWKLLDAVSTPNLESFARCLTSTARYGDISGPLLSGGAGGIFFSVRLTAAFDGALFRTGRDALTWDGATPPVLRPMFAWP